MIMEVGKNEKSYLNLEDINAYKKAYKLSNSIWQIVYKWGIFEKDTVGKQFVRAVDSISANIAEEFGRYSKKDKIRFYRFAYGSAMESIDWNDKANQRELIKDEYHIKIKTALIEIQKEIYSLIRFTNEKLKY